MLALGQLADDVQHLADELRVERARHLVEQQELGPHRQRAHDRRALLLAAGEPVRVLGCLVGETEAGEELRRTLLRVGLRLAQRLPRPERHVVEHAHVREEVEGLEDDADAAPHAC